MMKSWDGGDDPMPSILAQILGDDGCLRCLLLVMCTHPFAKKALTLHLARSEGHERYFGCNLMHCKVLASSHQHLVAEAPINGDVQLAPCALLWRFASVSNMNPQARAIDHQVDGLSARGFRNPQLLAEQPRAPTHNVE